MLSLFRAKTSIKYFTWDKALIENLTHWKCCLHTSTFSAISLILEGTTEKVLVYYVTSQFTTKTFVSLNKNVFFNTTERFKYTKIYQLTITFVMKIFFWWPFYVSMAQKCAVPLGWISCHFLSPAGDMFCNSYLMKNTNNYHW